MSIKISSEVTIYTDGSCAPNPGPGGWGFVVVDRSESMEIAFGRGQQDDTTNNQMELRAAIEGLKSLDDNCNVILCTDSKYVQTGITQWVKGWKRNNWHTSDRKPVKNVDLWIELDAQCERHSIRWKWVKGHSGHKWNDRADELASGRYVQVQPTITPKSRFDILEERIEQLEDALAEFKAFMGVN